MTDSVVVLLVADLGVTFCQGGIAQATEADTGVRPWSAAGDSSYYDASIARNVPSPGCPAPTTPPKI